MSEKNGPSGQKKDLSVFGKGTIAAIIGIFALLIIALVLINPGVSSNQSPAATPRVCSGKVIDYINTNLASPGQTASLINITENNGIYTIWSWYQSREISVYATKDCALLFTTAVNMNAATPAATPQVCSGKVIDYINTNLASPGQTASLINITENNGIYTIWSWYQSREISVYATKDCALLFTTAVNMNAAATPTPTRAPIKSARPVVDLYVMAFCPYGTQAETVMRPVVDLLGSTADIRVRYITTVSGSTPDSVKSLHGPPEAREDLMQLCVMTAYPEKYWNYLKDFNNQCYPVWQNASALASCRKNVLASRGIDASKIDTCATGSEGIALLRADEIKADNDDASASPTLIINGVKYSGARTPEAYKQAICDSFDSAPTECRTSLSAQQAANSGGGCG